MWLLDGEPICTVVGDQGGPQLTSDGSEGAIITWRDDRGATSDIYAQRIDANGNVVWTIDGVAVCTVDQNQTTPQIVGDGFGGAMIVWADYRSGGNWDVYAQRVEAHGDTVMPAGGEPICAQTSYQTSSQIVSDDSGGAIIAWLDSRNGDYDIYAQRITGPTPQITSIADVPEDQGRQVAVIWDRSYLDEPEYQVIGEYSIWRKYPEGMKWLGRQWDGTLPKELVGPVYRLIEERDPPGQVRTKAWEYIGSVDAHYLESYAYIAPTLWDSSATDAAYFSFFVSAHTTDPFIFYDSHPDSGYSVDDVAPAKTQAGIAASGAAKGSVNTIRLSWEQVTEGVDGSPEQGPIEYRVYCEESSDFVPGPGNLLTTTSELSYPHTDERIGDPAENLFYLVITVDGSGNESAASNRVGEFDRSLGNVK
jgi:hypothetical protein